MEPVITPAITPVLPSQFKAQPWGSVTQKSECETVARNVMVMLSRTGNQWRELTPEEYLQERVKDGASLSDAQWELPYFRRVVQYTISPEAAREFSPAWANI